MSRPIFGLVLGGILGLFDGLTAWFTPEARPMILAIVVGSTVKGVLTGLIAGLIARWLQSAALGILAGAAIGLALSTLAAMGQGDHYLEIIMPGMLVGGLVGYATQRYTPPGASGHASPGEGTARRNDRPFVGRKG